MKGQALMDVRQKLLEIIAANPGSRSYQIGCKLEAIEAAEWRSHGGLKRWAAGHGIILSWWRFFHSNFWVELYRLENEGLIRRERSAAAHWSPLLKKWIHSYHYFPG